MRLTPQDRLFVLTGAGISAESGLATFRGSGGLWNGHRVEDVATPEAWTPTPNESGASTPNAAATPSPPNPTLPTKPSPKSNKS
jgi:NAD-dependent SIR2 family protein deacetylase